LTAVWKYTG